MTTASYLKVNGLTGPVTAAGYAGDYSVVAYSFGGIGALQGAGSADYLDLELSSTADVFGLYAGMLEERTTPTVTLYVTDTEGGATAVTEQIALTGPFVAGYTDNDGAVSVSLGYSSAQVIAYDGTGRLTTTALGASEASPAPSPPAAAAPAMVFLSASGVNGSSSFAGITNALELNSAVYGYSRAAVLLQSSDVLDPVVVTLADDSQGAAQLLANAADGGTIGSLTLYETTQSETPIIEYAITLTNATVAAVQQAGGQMALAFDYASIKVTNYTPSHGGTSSTPGASETEIVGSGTNSLGLASLPSLSDTPLGDDDFLNVTGLRGPLTDAGYTGDFAGAGYSFDPASGALIVNLDQSAADAGVLGLYEDMARQTALASVTLFVTKLFDGTMRQVDKIVLTGAFVSGYADAGAGVSIALGYNSAAVTVTTYNALGNISNVTTATFDTPTPMPVGLDAPSPGTPGAICS